mmetsp:Transcript_5985/g.6714  ORF Transcript_5985/g.6714 Transcript_5985/m.6714 type:complete len:163 (+) Transcript_5985:65-553(+)
MAIDVHKTVLTNPLPNPASQTTTTVCRDHHHKNNQPIPAITAKNRPKTRPPTAKSPQTTQTPPKTIAEMMTHVFTTIGELIDEDTEAYIRTLLKNPLDDDTREAVRGILKEAMSPKRTQIVCDWLFRIVNANQKQERRKQQKQGNMTTATPPTASPPTNTKI